MTSEGRPGDLWTIGQVAEFLAVQPGSARGTMSRLGVKPVERRFDERGRAYSLYDPDEVREAHEARPGRGNWRT
ncbi:hypothetical protein QD712_25950 [Streptomyces acidiscabies]|uniref:hypothetical protein n=1 Tax=Streptomyces acidiscabies TaxID=42234 RepID=UPI0030CDA421